MATVDFDVCIQSKGRFEWIQLPKSIEEIKEIFDIPESEELYYEIVDFQAPFKQLPTRAIERLNELCIAMEKLPDSAIPFIDEMTEYEPLEEIIESGAENFVFYDALDEYGLGCAVVDSLGGTEGLSQEILERYFDYEAFGRDYAIESDGRFTYEGYMEYIG